MYDKLNGVLFLEDVFSREDLAENLLPDVECVVDLGCTYYPDLATPVPFYRVPLYLVSDAQKIIDQNPEIINIDPSNNLITTECFNFSLNKKTLNRYLLLKLLEYFDLKTTCYTWSGMGRSYDLSAVLDELSETENMIRTVHPIVINSSVPGYKHQMLQPVNKISTNLLLIDADRVIEDNYVITRSGYALLKDVFENAAISLIAESSTNDQNAKDTQIHFSEKTLYAMVGLNFPIWIGGYAQADRWKDLGFDVFEDVINHDYQYGSNLVYRCHRAIQDNLHLLRNLQLCTKLRQTNITRLLQNRHRVLSGDIYDCYWKAIDQLPESVRQCYFAHNHDLSQQ